MFVHRRFYLNIFPCLFFTRYNSYLDGRHRSGVFYIYLHKMMPYYCLNSFSTYTIMSHKLGKSYRFFYSNTHFVILSWNPSNRPNVIYVPLIRIIHTGIFKAYRDTPIIYIWPQRPINIEPNLWGRGRQWSMGYGA